MTDEITLLKFKLAYVPGDNSDIVASFDVLVNGFRIRKAQVRKSRGTGRLWMNVPRGHASDGIGISFPPGPVRDAVQGMATARYLEEIA